MPRCRLFSACASASVLTALMLALAVPAGAAPPDNRAYEMVSPVEKGGFSLSPNLVVANSEGNRVIVDGGAANSLLASDASWMLETRTATGWSGAQIGPSPAPEANSHEQAETGLVAVSQDFSRFAFSTFMTLDSRISRPSMNVFAREGAGGPLAWVSGPPAPLISVSEPSECGEGGVILNCTTNRAILAGTSATLGTFVWGQYHPLVVPPASLPGSPPDTHEHGYEVYESVDGVAQLTGLVPAGSGSQCGPSQASCVVPPCGAAMGNQSASNPTSSAFAPVQGSVSGDGSQVILTSPDPSTAGVEGCAPPEIYLREDGTTTLHVSASQIAAADPNGPREKKYAGSSEQDGHVNTVFFTSHEELTEDADTGGSDEGNDLYAYDADKPLGQRLNDVTPENNTPGASGNAEVTFLGSSSKGTIVYFTASSVLTAVPNAYSEVAQPGASNLYVYDSLTAKTTFIASGAGLHGPPIGVGETSTYGKELTSQVTADGQSMVFVSKERLTPYNNFGSECSTSATNGVPNRSPGPCAEVYVYSYPGDSLACVSCNPSGAPPTGSARLPTVFREIGKGSSREPGTLPLPRAVSDNGDRIFFDSPDRLTDEAPAPEGTHAPQAMANGGEYEPNVYEYEEGHVYLIAPAARFLTSTPSGNDVFFDTYAQLLPQDTDGLPDVYDARVDGGFPALASPVCSGTSCQGAPAAAAIFATPPTATFRGTGNFLECPSGKKLKNGHCVRRRHRKKAHESHKHSQRAASHKRGGGK